MSEKKEGDDFIGNELTIYNSEYIMTTPLEKQEYIIYKMMYPGLYILAGAPKIGKSWLALDLCMSVANGEQFLKHDTNTGQVSGMTFERKGMHQIELAVEDGKVDVLLVKDLSRLGRHRTRTALFIDYLRKNNVKVYSVTEGIDSSNENDDMIIGFKQLVNDFYAKDIGKKVRTGIRQKQKTGMTVNLPMGYYKDKNTGEVLVDETAAAIVREIFEKFFEGYGLSTIAKDFNHRGIKSPEYF